MAPLLQIRPHHPALPRAVQAILVTSGNALHAITPWPVPLLAVGDATAARARAAGFTDVRSAGRDGAALVTLALAMLRPDAGPLLLLSGAGQGGAVATGLRQAGFRVLRRVTYTAAPVRRFPPAAATAITAGALHAAIFLSGETAATFVRLIPPAFHHHLHGVVAVAIGKAAADALKPLPWRQVRQARTPTLDDVLALL
jgi:uroporphyrinogen-III synthase